MIHAAAHPQCADVLVLSSPDLAELLWLMPGAAPLLCGQLWRQSFAREEVEGELKSAGLAIVDGVIRTPPRGILRR